MTHSLGHSPVAAATSVWSMLTAGVDLSADPKSF